MKQKLLTFITTLMCSISMFADGKDEVYSVFDESTGTLTYYYDTKRATRSGVKELYNPEATRFKDYNTNVVKAVIDASMKYSSQTSLENLFYGAIDLKTNKAMSLSAMTSIDGLENLNTGIVTSMNAMFYGCKALTTLDLTSFNIDKVEDMQYMFMDCLKLTTILCNKDWSISEAQSSFMFSGCKALVGSLGTEFDASKTDKTYARSDGGTDTPGYFTATPHVYTEFDEETGTLTYYYDDQRVMRSGVTEMYDPVNDPYAVRFTSYYDQVKQAVITPSMKDAGLTSMKGMFYGGIDTETGTRQFLSAMTEIKGLEYLNTAKVTNMREMFYGCNALELLDLRTFSIVNVTNMISMFDNCKALTTIYCNDDWSGSTAESNKMFYSCKKLKGGEGTVYVYSTNDKAYARPDGSEKSPGYFTVPPLVYTVFDEGKGILTYYYDNKFDKNNAYHELYDPVNHPNAVRFNGYADKVVKGVIDESMKNASLTSLRGMFDGGENSYLVNMQTLYGLENLNTSNVTSMEDMFENCKSLISVDLTSFDFTNLENVGYMFWGCYELKTIYCNEDWCANDKITESDYMFFYCNSLTGGNGTLFSETKINKVYACPDGGTDSPGYFTVVPEIYTNFDESSGTLTYHYDHLRSTRSGVTELYDPIGNPSAVRFTGYYDQVKKAVIAPSMKDAGLTSTKRMFYGGLNSETETWQYLSAMTEIEGLENLNTEYVIDMNEMFYGCESLTWLDLRTFSISKVTGMTYMFNNCKALTTIYCNDDWSYSDAPSNKMFYNCKNLKGGKGTKYASSYSDENSDNTYARPDGLGGEPGYFSIMGDANGDGKATTADAEAIANYIMGNPPAGFNETLADVNRDGVINIADAVAVVNIIQTQSK